jgi:hypothetical protein
MRSLDFPTIDLSFVFLSEFLFSATNNDFVLIDTPRADEPILSIVMRKLEIMQ